MSNMLKGFWPGGPHDQTTPKASANNPSDERNPFESFASSSGAGAGSGLSQQAQLGGTDSAATAASQRSAGTQGAGAGAAYSLSAPTHDVGSAHGTHTPSYYTPSGLRTPGAVMSHAAVPTTSVSTTDPDFTMTLPPAKAKAEGSSAPSSATRNTAAPRGLLTVKLIAARNLLVTSTDSQPYAVVSFEQNEFIGREPIDETVEDSKGTAVPTGMTDPNGSRARAKTVTPADAGSSAAADVSGGLGNGSSRLGVPGPGSLAGSSAASFSSTASGFSNNSTGSSSTGQTTVPGMMRRDVTWRHEVTFDVTHSDKPIFLSVYDRQAEEEGFLGMKLIRPRLVHGAKSDQWYSLVARHDEADPDEFGAADANTSRGEVRLSISYERLASKKRLSPADFEYLKLIGRGTFGRVFQVRKKDTKRIYAMKVLSKREIALKKEVTHTMGERKILEKSLDCPFLVGLKFSFQSEHELYFVTDYKSGGELFWHLQREGRFTEERARFYIAELVLALEHLHKYDIVYRDLKPENILLDATGHVALCDFGLSKPDLGAGQLTNTFCGTTEYLAPEVLLDESGYSKLVDFWSLGVLLFEMCCGWSPFYAEDTQQMYRNICFGKIKFPRGAIGDDGKQFVKGLLNRNPKHRLGAHRDAQDLKSHAFFKDIDFEALAKKQLTPPFKPLVESDESVANFDPEFTETDLAEVALIPGFDDEDGDHASALGALENGDILGEGSGGKAKGGAAVPKKKTGRAAEEDEPLSSSVQQAFRGFSFGGRTYDAGSFGGSGSSFGGRRGSGGFGLAGASLGMSRMMVDDPNDGPRRAASGASNGGGTASGSEGVGAPALGGAAPMVESPELVGEDAKQPAQGAQGSQHQTQQEEQAKLGSTDVEMGQ